MNNKKFTTLAAGVAAALLVSALAFTMVSCGGDEFTQEDVDAAYADGMAAVKTGTTDKALVDLYLKVSDTAGVYTIAGAGNGTGDVVKLAADGKLVYGAGANDFVTITNGAVKSALALLVTNDEEFTVGYADIPGLGERAWIAKIDSKKAAVDSSYLSKLFGATNSVELKDEATALDGTVPKTGLLITAAATIAPTKTLTVNGTLVTGAVTVTGKIVAEAGATVNGVTFPAKTDTITVLATKAVTAGNIVVPAGKELVIANGTLTVVKGSTVELKFGSTATGDGAIRLITSGNVTDAILVLGTPADDNKYPKFVATKGDGSVADTIIAVRPSRIVGAITAAGTVDTLYVNRLPDSAASGAVSNGLVFASNSAAIASGASQVAVAFTAAASGAAAIASSATGTSFATGGITVNPSTGLISVLSS